MDCSIMENQIPISTEEPSSFRNWVELPPDVLAHIFLKLGSISMFYVAKSFEPLLFRSVDMRNRWDLFDGGFYDMEKMARGAVDSWLSSPWNILVLMSLCSSLRCLRLVSCYQVSDDALINMAKKAVMLEELEICYCSFSEDMLKAVGKACPQLKSFRLNSRCFRRPRIEIDEEALSIAENMPQLRHLHLFGNKLTNVGLRGILDGCLHLESLDLRQCFNLNLEADLLKSCKQRLIKLRLPNDSTDEYEFDAAIDDGYDEFYGYEDDPSGLSDIDFDGYDEYCGGSYISSDDDDDGVGFGYYESEYLGFL
ncbi:hypothetical protein C5167_037221 [Papaver somniferum]|uniref:F-box/LRR-repeat protein 15/At3g58940/PEG3-like LRR domain-containing protein n=1 Tax=Papaver somniferum TaxID=3469 RepID=A0A4Y7I9F9_PAPSO|nr:hypothetical protein C5167_037221 [Papaver somniferum]